MFLSIMIDFGGLNARFALQIRTFVTHAPGSFCKNLITSGERRVAPTKVVTRHISAGKVSKASDSFGDVEYPVVRGEENRGSRGTLSYSLYVRQARDSYSRMNGERKLLKLPASRRGIRESTMP